MNDIFQLVIAYACAGQYMENVLHYSSSLASSINPESDATSLITAFQGGPYLALIPCVSSDAFFLGMKAKRVNNTGGPSVVAPAVSGAFGTGPAGVMDTRAAAVITGDYYNAMGSKPAWRVARQFIGGVPSTWMVDNVWISDAITAYLAYCTSLESSIGSSPTFDPIAWSPLYTTAYAILNWELTPNIGSLKRRIKPSL